MSNTDPSSARPKLTILVTCGNEERNVDACLQTAQWADELFVVIDAAGTDRSEELSRRYTSRVVRHEYVNAAAQKNWAIPQVAHEWVLVLDADERITPELRTRIENVLLRDGDGCDAFRIQRRSFFLGKRIKHCGWGRDSLVRLFRRDKCRYAELHVHADVVVSGPVGDIREFFLHDTMPDFSRYFGKFDRYTTWAAQDLYARGRKAGVRNLLFRPLYRFFRMYVLQLGFLEGGRGIILCGLGAVSVFAKYAKLWELRHLDRDGHGGDGEPASPSGAASERSPDSGG